MMARKVQANHTTLGLPVHVERLQMLTNEKNNAPDVPHPAGGPDLGQASPDLVTLNRSNMAAPIGGLGTIRHFMVPAFHIGFFIFSKMYSNACSNFTAS